MSPQPNLGQPGFAQPSSSMGQFNQHSFLIEQSLARLSTAMPVRVTAVHSGGVAPVGLVDVQPLVSQVNPNGQTYEQPIIPNVPYNRLQGGANAVIIDPVVGDIGIAVFASRDMSSVVNARKAAPPGSARMFDMSDAMYVGGILNAAPTQYIQFSAAGIKIFSPTACEVDAPAVTVNASSSATVSAPAVSLGASGGEIQALVDERILAWASSHTHTSAVAGSPTSAPIQTLPTCTTSATKAS